MKLRMRLAWIGLPLIIAQLALPAQADTSKDIQVAGRALSFLENGPSGRVVIGVVFDPSKAASVAQKDAVMAALGSGLEAGSLTLTGKPMEVGAISGGVAALYLTSGVNFAAAAAAAKSHKLITISADSACVTSGDCVMGVTTTPKVEIKVNRAAAAAIGVSFKSAFRMMITEI